MKEEEKKGKIQYTQGPGLAPVDKLLFCFELAAVVQTLSGN